MARPGIFAAECGSFVGIQLMMSGGYRDRVIGGADCCACMHHWSLQESKVSKFIERLEIYCAFKRGRFQRSR